MSSQEFKTDITAQFLAEAAKMKMTMPMPPPLQLEDGKFYRTRGNRRVQAKCRGPAERVGHANWWLQFQDGQRVAVNSRGEWSQGCETISDVVAEWVEPSGIQQLGDTIWVQGAPTALPYPPLRVQILNDAARLTSGERDKEYGPPAVNMAAAGELKAVFRKHLARDMSAGELEAIDLALTKLGRIATGKPKRDTYVDAAAYLAIAGEIALGDKDE